MTKPKKKLINKLRNEKAEIREILLDSIARKAHNMIQEKHILVLGDQRVTTFLDRLKAANNDFTFEVANNELKLIEMALKKSPDLIIMNSKLQNISGKVLNRVLLYFLKYEVPTLFVVFNKDDGTKLEILNDPSKDHILSPFTMKEFVNKVKSFFDVDYAKAV